MTVSPRYFLIPLVCVLLAWVLWPTGANAKTDQSFWPDHTGMLLMNKKDQNRVLDARPGNDPFGGQDANYRCQGNNPGGKCLKFLVAGPDGGKVVGNKKVHHKLLGGHGNDTIFAGPYGDVIWGDYKPSGQPSTQRDTIQGGGSRDYIYASHGYNDIHGGGGNDYIKAHYGRGKIDCGAGKDRLYISRRAKKKYTITNCETVSHKTLGY